MEYTKNVTTIGEQIRQLKCRGLIIMDEQFAAHWLSVISYYRLAGYWWPMQSDKLNHIFKPNSRFEDVLSLYHFDRELRLLLFGIIGRIEIALRTKLIYHLSHEHGFWWFQNISLFKNAPELIKTLATIEEEFDRNKETFIKEHKKKYRDDGRFPPAHKSLEITSFGNLSRLYGNLRPTVKSKDLIASEFKTVNHSFLPSWLQSISQIRNLCAHHCRLWNKNLPGKPNLLPKPPAPWLTNAPRPNEFHMLYVHICCMKYLLNVIDPDNLFKQRLLDLLSAYPAVDHNALGLKSRWEDEPLWR